MPDLNIPPTLGNGGRGRQRFEMVICADGVGRPLVTALPRDAGHSGVLCQHREWPTLVNYSRGPEEGTLFVGEGFRVP
eukprot:6583696-Pyramimonas_sp.AAC.1